MAARWATSLVLVACSSGKPRAVEDAKHPGVEGGGAAADGAVKSGSGAGSGSGSGAPGPTSGPATGDVSVRVEWPRVPAAVRASPGTTACNTPRAPQVAPSTTWGIGDTVVLVDGAPASLGLTHVRLTACELVPRIAVGMQVVVDSAADRPALLALAQVGSAADLRTRLASPRTRALQLPIAGHGVTALLELGAIYELRGPGTEPETAWLVAAPAAVTDASGVAVIKDVPVGAHAVRAWLPPRSGQPARFAAGQVVVAAGELSELTLTLEP